MEREEKSKLTKEWVMVMLYKNPMSLDDLVINGCRVMVYGWELPEFRDIVADMIGTDKTINGRVDAGNLSLSTDGIFYIKKNTLLPLIQISEDAGLLTSFVEENKEKCDTKFLEELSTIDATVSKENKIKDFARNNYDKIAGILILLIPFLLTYV